MFYWLKRLLIGDSCAHEWEESQRYEGKRLYDQRYVVHVLRCKKCGKLHNHYIK